MIYEKKLRELGIFSVVKRRHSYVNHCDKNIQTIF